MAQFDLALIEKGAVARHFPLRASEAIVGRSRGADIPLDGKSVSREHVRLRVTEDEVLLEDLGSRNGFKVNGVRLRSSILKLGDWFEVGSHLFQLRPHKEATPQPAGPVATPHVRAATPGTNGSGSAGPSNRLEFRKNERCLHIFEKANRFAERASDRVALLDDIVQSAMELTGARRGCVLLQNSARSSPVVLSSRCVELDTTGPAIIGAVYEEVVRRRCVMMRPYELPADSIEAGMGAAVCAPLGVDDRAFGAIYLDSGYQPGQFNTEALEDLRAYALLCGEPAQAATQGMSQAATQASAAI